ncbi:hypothetical protein JCM5296_002361 [Sporobolomyces johnsonii]
MYLVHQLLNLCRDTRQEVRNAAITNVLRSISIPDYRPHLDGLMLLQSAVLEVVAALKLEVPGAASAVLSISPSHSRSLRRSRASRAPARRAGSTGRSVTYISLAEEAMPHVFWLFQKCKDVPSVYAPGAVDKILAAYAHPMRLSHTCPAPGKFGSAEPWDVVPALRTFAQIVQGYRGALLAELRSLDELHAEENFDLALLLSLEQDDLLTLATLSLVPDDLIRDLGKTLVHLASRLYELDLPIRFPEESRLAHQQSFSSLQQPVGADHTPPPTPPELRFDGRGGEDLTYVANAPLRRKMPFLRTRQEELPYVLQ